VPIHFPHDHELYCLSICEPTGRKRFCQLRAYSSSNNCRALAPEPLYPFHSSGFFFLALQTNRTSRYNLFVFATKALWLPCNSASTSVHHSCTSTLSKYARASAPLAPLHYSSFWVGSSRLFDERRDRGESRILQISQMLTRGMSLSTCALSTVTRRAGTTRMQTGTSALPPAIVMTWGRPLRPLYQDDGAASQKATEASGAIRRVSWMTHHETRRLLTSG